MGLSNGPADTPVQAQSSSHDGETAPQAPKGPPKWLREGARPRRTVPLRTSAPNTLPVPYGTPGRSPIVDLPADEGVAFMCHHPASTENYTLALPDALPVGL